MSDSNSDKVFPSGWTPVSGPFDSKSCDYSGIPPFADAEWADDPDPLCLWCAGTGHPYGDSAYGMCKCPERTVSKVKAISLWQPWASLIAWEIKTVETRSWAAPKTIIGKSIAIHAAKTTKGFSLAEQDPELIDFYKRHPQFAAREAYPLGSIVAIARVESCRPTIELQGDIFGDYTEGRFGWVLSDVRSIEAIPVRGRQGIFEVDLESSFGSEQEEIPF